MFFCLFFITLVFFSNSPLILFIFLKYRFHAVDDVDKNMFFTLLNKDWLKYQCFTIIYVLLLSSLDSFIEFYQLMQKIEQKKQTTKFFLELFHNSTSVCL